MKFKVEQKHVAIVASYEYGKMVKTTHTTNSRILPLLGPTLILPWVQKDPSIILHYYLVGTQILQL